LDGREFARRVDLRPLSPAKLNKNAEGNVMAIDWSRLRNIVESHNHFVITSHVRPDGDSIGSELGMAELLTQKGKQYSIVNSSPLPPRYRFLDPTGRIRQFGVNIGSEQLQRAEVVIIVDTSAWIQLGSMADFVRNTKAKKIIVDHHVSEDDLGAELFKDSSAAACGILLAEAAEPLGCSMTRALAEPLFVAIATDTGWFRFGSTNGRTLRIAAALVDSGVAVDKIYRTIFEESSVARLKLMGRTLQSITVTTGGRVAYGVVRQRDIAESQAIPQDTEDLVNYTLSMTGIELGMLFVELSPSETKVSFRSRDGVDCTRIAAQFGGGGHRQAAGASVSASVDATLRQVLQVVQQAFAAPGGN
jgi:bifunctional oligoribonuclease and PAP phosphatase NrnA